MSTIIELPNGTAVLKDDAELTNREVKSLRKAARVATSIALGLEKDGYTDEDPESWKLIATLDESEYDDLDLFQRSCVIVRLESWTLDLPLPKTVDEVDDLPRPVYIPLIQACANIQLSDDFTLEASADPKVVIENSDN